MGKPKGGGNRRGARQVSGIRSRSAPPGDYLPDLVPFDYFDDEPKKRGQRKVPITLPKLKFMEGGHSGGRDKNG